MDPKLAVREPHLIHSPRIRPHTRADDSALQGRASGSRPAQKEIPVANYQLSVCADVKKDADLILPVQARGRDPADNIPAQVIGFAGEAVDIPADGKAKLRTGQKAGMVGPNRVGGGEYAEGVHPQEEMDHRRVPGDHHLDTGGRRHSGLRFQKLQKLQDGLKRG